MQQIRYATASDLHLEHQHWSNPRAFSGLSNKEIAELGEDIKRRGIQVPVLVQRVLVGDDREINLVLDGQRRVLAVRASDKDMPIPVVDRSDVAIRLTPETSDSLLLDMLSVASRREGLSSFELSEVAAHLRERDRTLAEIGQAIGRSESWVSKFLTARASATGKLMQAWRHGKITDEQFKDLAATTDKDQQAAAVTEVTEARKEGDVTTARTVAKEQREKARDEEEKRVVRGPQTEMEATKPPKPVVPSKAKLEDMVALSEKRPPTSDYVRGMLVAVKYVLGSIGERELGKPWVQYLERCQGVKLPKAANVVKVKLPKAPKPIKSAEAGTHETFKVGDWVTWSSSANGTTLTKTGRVVAVVPAGQGIAGRTDFKVRGAGSSRYHTSYIVEVPRATSPEYFWPLVSKLKPGKAK